MIKDEKDLIFIGLVAMMDPLMITCDHRITAAAIAKQIWILKDESESIMQI